MDKTQQMTETLARFICLMAKELPDDVTAALQKLRAEETGALASAVYGCMFDNLAQAKALGRPVCQDTGVLQFFIRAGAHFPLLADVGGICRNAVLEATKRAPLRPNAVEAFGGKNTGTNTGTLVPWIEWDILPGGGLEMDIYMAGGGSSLPGRAVVLVPSAGYEAIVRCVFDAAIDWGVNACPPLIVGVGIGTDAPTAAKLSKKALLRPVGTVSANPRAADMELRLKDGLNAVGLGPQGLSGKATVLDVHIEYMAHHPATLAVGVSLGCWATRRGTIRFCDDLTFETISHRGAAL
jgi:hydro-lyases, Fe-S type, tartrate/fumarate subfamily, alpha region